MSSEHIQNLMNKFEEEHQGENLNIHGFIYVRTFDPTTDETKEERFVPNIITNRGFNKYLENVFGVLATTLRGTFLAIGTGYFTTPAGTSTALDSELAVARGVGTFSHTADTAQGTVAYTFSTGGPWAIAEMGLFDAAAAGSMLCRGTFAVVNKGTADSFEGKYIHSLS